MLQVAFIIQLSYFFWRGNLIIILIITLTSFTLFCWLIFFPFPPPTWISYHFQNKAFFCSELNFPSLLSCVSSRQFALTFGLMISALGSEQGGGGDEFKSMQGGSAGMGSKWGINGNYSVAAIQFGEGEEFYSNRHHTD